MILSEETLRGLLAAAAGSVDLPPRCGVLLEGSIAEGFGNDTSDVDFLVVDPGDREFVTMPTLVFVHGRRVELRFRSMAQLRRQTERLRALAAAPGRDPAAFEDLLNRCQRLSRGVPLRGVHVVRAAQALLSEQEIRDMTAGWYRARARRCGRYVVALTGLGCADAATDWAGSALVYAAKAWSAGRGETYLGIKWTADQFRRAGPPDALHDRYTALTGPSERPDGAAGRVEESLALLNELLDDDGVEPDPSRVRLTRLRNVTTWQLGTRVHIVRNRRQVYLLGSVAAAVWRTVAFDLPLPEALRRNALPAEIAGPTIARLHRLGLVAMTWRGGGTIRPARVRSVAVGATGIGTDGARAIDGEEAADGVLLAALPAPAFAEAGMAHVWTNLEIENAREDLAGAVARGQDEVARSSGQRMLRQVCLLLLCANGHHPLPAPEEAVREALSLPELPDSVRAGVVELDTIYRRRTARAGADPALPGLLADVVTDVRRYVRGTAFPECFASADGWRETLDIGYDWVRLGAYLRSTFPIEEVGDLAASGGARPDTARSGPAMESAG